MKNKLESLYQDDFIVRLALKNVIINAQSIELKELREQIKDLSEHTKRNRDKKTVN